MVGHPQGASGACGIVTTALAIDRGFLPPTINVARLDPACEMDVLPNEGRAVDIEAALCNCLGFGSKNSAVVVGRAVTPRPDVIVSGGGPAGHAGSDSAGTWWGTGGAVDRDAFPRHKLCGDTLNPGGVALLRASGLAGPIETHGLPLEGMLVTGATGVSIRGTYGDGLVGRAWARRHLDLQLLEAAAAPARTSGRR